MICASVYLLVFIQNILVHLAEKILLPQPLTFGGITEAAAQDSVYEKVIDPARAIMASAKKTGTTIVAPLTANVIWRISATFYVAP